MTNFTSSSTINVPSTELNIVATAGNNQALLFFQDSSYSMAMIVEYLSYAVAFIALLFFFAGYFGSKLQSIEAAAVVQVSALLVMTL